MMVLTVDLGNQCCREGIMLPSITSQVQFRQTFPAPKRPRSRMTADSIVKNVIRDAPWFGRATVPIVALSTQ